jgi:hypothetical protein
MHYAASQPMTIRPYSSCHPLPCGRPSRPPWWDVTPTTHYDGSVTLPLARFRRSRGTSLRYVLAPLRASTHPLRNLIGSLPRSRIAPASGSCQCRAWHRLQALFRWVRTTTTSGFEFRQSSFTLRERVIRMPCPTTLSGMHRLLDMLCPFRLSRPGMPITQEYFLNSSCLQQGYHNAPHGAHRACGFPRTRLSSKGIHSFKHRAGFTHLTTYSLVGKTTFPCSPSSCLRRYPERLATMGTPSP